MTHFHRPQRARSRHRRARGWTLVETAIAVSLLALTALAVNDLVIRNESLANDEQSQDRISKAADAITGWAYVKFSLPRPSLAKPATWSAAYLQGKLPSDSLGLEMDGPLVYTVPAAFTAELKTAQWPADPRGWLSDKDSGFVARDAKRVNGMDLCKNLLEAQRTKMGWSDGRTVAFGLQESSIQASSGALPPFEQPPQASTTAIINGQTVPTRLNGHMELANDLGCVDRAVALAVALKSASVAQDTLNLSRRTREYLDAEASLLTNVNSVSVWRLVNEGLYRAVSEVKAASLIALTIGGETTAATVVQTTAASVQLATQTAAIADYIFALTTLHKKSSEAVQRLNDKYKPMADAMANASAEVLRAQAARLKELEEKGIRP